jgi:hypothetical protein
MTAVDLDLDLDDVVEDEPDARHAFCRWCNVIAPGQLATALCGHQQTVPNLDSVYVIDLTGSDVCAACVVRWPTHDCIG